MVTSLNERPNELLTMEVGIWTQLGRSVHQLQSALEVTRLHLSLLKHENKHVTFYASFYNWLSPCSLKHRSDPGADQARVLCEHIRVLCSPSFFEKSSEQCFAGFRFALGVELTVTRYSERWEMVFI